MVGVVVVLGVVPSCFLLLLVRVLGCLRCFLLSLSTGACEDPLVFVLGTGGEVAGAPGAVASAGLPLVCAVGLCPVPRTPSECQRDQKVSGGDQKGLQHKPETVPLLYLLLLPPR